MSENTRSLPTSPLHYDSTYAITSDIPFTEYDKGLAEDGTLFTTEGQGMWLVQPPTSPMRLLRAENPYMLNGASEELGKRQRCGTTTHDRDILHRRNQAFFSTNWDVLAEIFYEPDIPKPTGLKRFSEVDLNDYEVHDPQDLEKKVPRTAGSVDFIGEGHDGQIIIVEFGKTSVRKTKQLDRHSAATEEVIKRTNHADPEDPTVSAYIGIYDRHEHYQKIRLMGPRFYVPIVGSKKGYYAAD